MANARRRWWMVLLVLAAAATAHAQPGSDAPGSERPAADAPPAEQPRSAQPTTSKPPPGQAPGEVAERIAEEPPWEKDSRRFRLPPPEWTVTLEGRLWWTSPSGKVKLPARSGSGPAGFATSGDSVSIQELNLDTPRLSPAGELHVAADKWRFSFTGAAFSLDRDYTEAPADFRIGSIEVDRGEPLSTRFEYSVFELTAGRELWSRDYCKGSGKPENAIDVQMRTLMVGGVRFHDVDIGVRSLLDGATADTDQFFIEPVLGVRVEMDVLQDFGLEVQATGGGWFEGDRSIWSIDVGVAFLWRPRQWLALEIGWRQVVFSMNDGDDAWEFEYSGAMAGVFGGVVVRF